jgi:hypothetical protein
MGGCQYTIDSLPPDTLVEIDGRSVQVSQITQMPVPPDGTPATLVPPGPGDVFVLGTRHDRAALSFTACTIGDLAFSRADIDALNLPNPRMDAAPDEQTFFSFGAARAESDTEHSITCDMADVSELLVAYVPD